MYTNKQETLKEAEQLIKSAFEYSKEKLSSKSLIYKIIH